MLKLQVLILQANNENYKHLQINKFNMSNLLDLILLQILT